MILAQSDLETILGPEFGPRTPARGYPRPAEGKPCRGEPDDGDERAGYALNAVSVRPDGEDGDWEGVTLLTFRTRAMAMATCEVWSRDRRGLPDITVPDCRFLVVNGPEGNEVCRREIRGAC